jgi:hypothetical protein
MILNSHLGDSFFTIFAQTNQGNATNASSGSKATEISNSFSAMGQIGSLVITVPESQFNITNAFEVVLIGEWNLCVRDGSITNFDVNFLASPMGNTYYIDPNEKDTENHFGNQQVYGIITRLIS